jgi:hypothetical protein
VKPQVENGDKNRYSGADELQSPTIVLWIGAVNWRSKLQLDALIRKEASLVIQLTALNSQLRQMPTVRVMRI